MTTLLEGSIPGLPHDDKSHMAQNHSEDLILGNQI
jgi:hypothetical protein